MAMKNNITNYALLSAIVLAFSITSCLTAKKMDSFVAQQYNNQLPKPTRKSSENLSVQSAMPSGGSEISTTVHKTDKFLPLLVYWHVKESQNCTLNTAIAQTSISNILNGSSTKVLEQKLNGQKLELSIEEVPTGFSLIDDAHAIWLLYAISWSKVYVQPDAKDLVVSYKVMQSDSTFKTGKVTVRNTQPSKNLRFFQSWKSAVSEFIQSYNSNLTIMARSLVSKLSEEL
jgi:hypothetical protein